MICGFCPVHAQTEGADTTAASKKTVDTLFHPTTPIPHAGSLDPELSPRHIITDSGINFTNYKYAGDLIGLIPGIFIRDLGGVGQTHGITIDGVDGRGIVFMNDGIMLNDPLTAPIMD